MRLSVQLAFICLVISGLCNYGYAQGKRHREYSGFFDSYYFRGPITYTLGVNLTAYRGDLSSGLIGTNSLGYGLSIGANYKTWPRIAFGGEFSYFTLSGKDHEDRRAISFTSTNMELLAYGRFYFVDETVRVAPDRKKERDLVFFKPYFTTGIGFLLYTPVSTSSILAVDTLKEGKSYPGYGPVIPVGLGFSLSHSHRLSFVLEATYRFTFTDHLDDVSTRGNSPKKDGYGFVSFKVQYCPGAPAKKKKQKLAPPEKYDGPKGTKTWKNTPREEKKPKNNYYEESDTTGGGNLDEQNPDENTGEEQPQEENPDQEPQEEGQQPVEQKEEESGWGN